MYNLLIPDRADIFLSVRMVQYELRTSVGLVSDDFAVFSFSFHQSAMSKNCVKLLCEDPVFAEYIKCILMDERTFLNNNIVYTFLTHFLLKVCVFFGGNVDFKKCHKCSFSLGYCFHSSIFLCFKKKIRSFHRSKGRCFLKQTVPT